MESTRNNNNNTALVKKRSISLISPEEIDSLTNDRSLPPSAKWTLLHQHNQIESLQAELDHARSARRLDQRGMDQSMQQLQQHLAMAQDQAVADRALHKERMAEKDARIQQLVREKSAAESLQQQMLHMEGGGMDRNTASDHHFEEECDRLRIQLQAAYEREASFATQITELQSQITEQLEKVMKQPSSQPEQKIIEPAPPAVMSELSRARIRSAEADRTIRELERKVTEQDQRYTKLSTEHEQQQRSVAGASTLRTERDALSQECAALQAELAQWRELQTGLVELLGTTNKGPPEVATIRRFLMTAREERDTAQRNLAQRIQQEADKAKTDVATSDPNSAAQRQTILSLQSQLAAAEQQAQLFQRETKSLTELMQSFEVQIARQQKGNSGTMTPTTYEPSAAALRIQVETLQAAQVQRKEHHDALTKELSETQENLTNTTAELSTVKVKFGKLKDALMAEREKVAEAQAKAVQAEELAGKGSFDPAKTRVLHFRETPLVQALKEEVGVLKRQVEATATGKAGSGAVAGVDPEKLNQRLKEHFKEQISLFREGVYLMTGFKIDMLPNNTGTGDVNKPTFRLRSVFAEQEDDHLLLQWPVSKEPVKSLDILETELAKVLAQTPAYQYMTTSNSLPAFLASVQLSLFETQTMV